MSDWWYKRKEECKEKGLCVDCRKPLDRDGVRCVSCNDKHNQKNKERREWYQSAGICPKCGENPIMGDEKMCPECRAYAYKIVMGRRDFIRKRYNSDHAKWSRKAYAERKAQGICTRCGKRKADHGYVMCGICREKDRNRKRIAYGKPDRRERCLSGLCFFCDNPIKDGYKVCEKHYQMNVEKARSSNANKARVELQKSGILY